MTAPAPTTSSPMQKPGPGARIWNGIRRYLSDIRRFSRNARLYLVGSFLMALNMQVFQVLLNLYLKERGLGEGQIGLVVSARAAGMTLIAVPAALLLARVKLKPVLLVSCVLFAVFSFYMVEYSSILSLLAFSLFSGMAFVFYRVGAAPFYMRSSTRAERTHLFSFSFATMILAGMIGSLGAGNMAASLGEKLEDLVSGYQYTLYSAIGVSLLAVVPFFLIRASRPSAAESRISLSSTMLKKRGGYYLKITLINFAIGLGAGLIIPFLNLYFRDRFNQPPDAIGTFYFGVHFSMLAGSLAGPVLARKFGLVRAVVITQLASMPFLLILAYSHTLPVAVAAFIIRGGLMNVGVPIITNLGMELSEKREQGLVNALLIVSWMSSRMVATAIGGRLIELHGYTFTMNITILLYVASSIALYLFFRKVEVRGEGSTGWVVNRNHLS